MLNIISVRRNAISGSVNLMGEGITEKGKNDETTVYFTQRLLR